MHKLGIIVPYRKREEQLSIFKQHLTEYLDNSLKIPYVIIIVDQVDNKKFNRGKLLNIGYLEAKKRNCTYVVFHDVDMLPVEVSYEYSDYPLQLANSFIKDGDFNRTIQRNYFGGVTLFKVEDFDSINGYSNKYKGWGFEDDDLLHRCREVGLSLENESYRTLNFNKRLLYFDGSKSFVRIKNNYITVRPYSYVVTFYPDKIKCNPSEITDEFAVFGIPGLDLNLAYNSFSNYKFELFTKNKVPVALHSDYMPNLPMQVVVNVSPGKNRIQYFLNGKEVGTKYWGDVSMRNYKSEPYLYLGVADPTRNKKQKFFSGYISNFGVIYGEVTLETVRKMFMSDPNLPLNEQIEELKENDRWYGYFDSLNYNRVTKTLPDTSGRHNHAEVSYCLWKEVNTSKVTRVKFPKKRNGLFKLIKHDEAGYTDGFWKDWSSRENQLRYYRLLNSGSSNYMNDGLSTCKFRSTITVEENNYIKLNALT